MLLPWLPGLLSRGKAAASFSSAASPGLPAGPYGGCTLPESCPLQASTRVLSSQQSCCNWCAAAHPSCREQTLSAHSRMEAKLHQGWTPQWEPSSCGPGWKPVTQRVTGKQRPCPRMCWEVPLNTAESGSRRPHPLLLGWRRSSCSVWYQLDVQNRRPLLGSPGPSGSPSCSTPTSSWLLHPPSQDGRFSVCCSWWQSSSNKRSFIRLNVHIFKQSGFKCLSGVSMTYIYNKLL